MRTTIERIRGSAAVALECLKSAHTQGDARRYIQQVLDGIDVAMSLGEFGNKSEPTRLTDEQIKHMVNRFLCWRLPETFNPDCGIHFDADAAKKLNPRNARYEPTGTNLFDAAQTDAMVRHIIWDLPTNQ
jgi:hypothetical protein